MTDLHDIYMQQLSEDVSKSVTDVVEAFKQSWKDRFQSEFDPAEFVQIESSTCGMQTVTFRHKKTGYNVLHIIVDMPYNRDTKSIQVATRYQIDVDCILR